MAWTVVETPNARYVLLFSSHSRRTEPVPEKFDALVLEKISLNPEELIKEKQYENLIYQTIKEGKQIWVTDVYGSAKDNQVDFFKKITNIIWISGLKAITPVPLGFIWMKKAMFQELKSSKKH